MSPLTLIIVILVMAIAGYVMGRSRALASAGGDSRGLHSLPNYYGMNVVLAVLAPSLIVLVIWLVAQPIFVGANIQSSLAEALGDTDRDASLVIQDVHKLADGLGILVDQDVVSEDELTSGVADIGAIREQLGEVGVALGSDVDPVMLVQAQAYRSITYTANWALTFVVLGLAIFGFVVSYLRVTKDYRARNVVERAVMVLLIGAASIAILTTVGIVFSLVFNTIEFFNIYPASDFFFLLEWAPSFSGRGGSSSLGFLPLLWGTLYISIIALFVAVPIGLFAAIYLSEYAGPKTRSIVKPLLEVLAGIPTVVYGLFALLTVGPLLMSVFGPGGTGWMGGGTSVMTAGLVMGIMLIPFVSSLSDDIINAVPQAMRDGSFGLGATKSETIRQVILPAALPGIVGAILLAGSRAIGETMIVVLGAGAAARLSLNPFEAMTTVTAKIVSQLTGDSDFSSPVALVAFALGTTLFVITLGLNVVALYIVRKYREQYD